MIDYIRPLYEFKDKIFHVHYKDIKVNKDARNDVGILATPLSYMLPCIPGHGDVDWSEYIRVLLETGYKGAACIEIEGSRIFLLLLLAFLLLYQLMLFINCVVLFGLWAAAKRLGENKKNT